MRQVRYGVFETNSSSTHSLVICTQDEYKQFQKDEVMYDRYEDKLVPYSGLLLDTESYRYQSYRQYGYNELESFYNEFVTPSGDKMVAFGQYGYNG